jgi:two-component system chemotaxis response regulator CheB
MDRDTDQQTAIRVLIADDSALMRTLITRLFSRAPDIEVTATARDGEDAYRKAVEIRPDVVTMDINMPKLDGISAMQMIVAEQICPVIMFSSLTQQGALETFECLQLGAFDFVPKPEGTVSANLDRIADELVAKVRAAAASGPPRRFRLHGGVLERGSSERGSSAREVSARKAATARSRSHASAPLSPASAAGDFHAIAIGISTGGPATISTLLPELPADLPAAVFLVQHMPAQFIGTFVARLQKECAIEVATAEQGASVRPGVCYVAGNDLHLCVHRKRSGELVLRTPRLPQTLFVPSVNVMMESVLAVFGPKTIGVLMTGIGDDGADQMVQIRQAGGMTIAESQESCVVFGMPFQAIRRGGAEVVLPSWEIAARLVKMLRAPRAAASRRADLLQASQSIGPPGR